MKQLKKLGIAIFCCLLLSSCASLLGGLNDSTRVKPGYPAEALVYFNGEFQGYAPTSFPVPKSSRPGKSFIEIKAEGYLTEEVKIRRKVSVGFALMDLFLTLGVGLVFDFANGNIYKIRPNRVDYHLLPDPNYNPSKDFNYLVGDTVFFRNDEYDGYKGVIIGMYPESAIVRFKRPPNNQEIDQGINEEVVESTKVRYRDLAVTARQEFMRKKLTEAPNTKLDSSKTISKFSSVKNLPSNNSIKAPEPAAIKSIP